MFILTVNESWTKHFCDNRRWSQHRSLVIDKTRQSRNRERQNPKWLLFPAGNRHRQNRCARDSRNQAFENKAVNALRPLPDDKLFAGMRQFSPIPLLFRFKLGFKSGLGPLRD